MATRKSAADKAAETEAAADVKTTDSGTPLAPPEKDAGENVEAAKGSDDSTTPEQVRTAEQPPKEDKAPFTIETVIAAEPSAAQAYMDGWTQNAPKRNAPDEARTNDSGKLESTDDSAKAVRGFANLVEANKEVSGESEVVEPRGAAMPTIPLYHAHAALSALNGAVDVTTGDEDNHAERLARANAEATTPEAAEG